MKITAWKTSRVGEKYFYTMQIDKIEGIREENRLKKLFSKWKLQAEGYNPKDKTSTLIFFRAFGSDDEWIDWARQVPYPLVEVGKSGKEKPYKLGLNYINSPRRRGEND